MRKPWRAVERRVRAAAAGDFVVAFYNPVSKRRTRQLAEAVAILRQHRPNDTPVVLARNLGRAGETVTTPDLADLTPDKVDMLTVELVGSSEQRGAARGPGGEGGAGARRGGKKCVRTGRAGWGRSNTNK